MLGEGFHDRLGQVDDGVAFKETPKGLHPHARIGEEERALAEFAQGDKTDPKAVPAKRFRQPLCLDHPGDGVDDPIGIDEVSHGRSGGRVPSSRAR